MAAGSPAMPPRGWRGSVTQDTVTEQQGLNLQYSFIALHIVVAPQAVITNRAPNSFYHLPYSRRLF